MVNDWDRYLDRRFGAVQSASRYLLGKGVGLAATAGYNYFKGKSSSSFSSASDMPAIKNGRKKYRAPPTPDAGRVAKRRKRSGAKVKFIGPLNRIKSKNGARPGYPRGGSFRKGRRGKSLKKKWKHQEKFEMKGVVVKREYNGKTTDGECVYVGHGTPLQQVVYIFWRAIYRSLMAKAGIEIVNWDHTVPATAMTGTLQIRLIFYLTSTSSSSSTVLVPITTATDSHYVISNNLATAFNSGTVVGSIPMLETIQLEASTTIFPAATMDLSNFHIELDYWSKIKIQNLTVPASLVGTDHDEDLMSNVANEPLIGKLYATKKWQNGFQPVGRDYNITGFTPFLADKINGNLEANSGKAGIDDAFNLYRKPPPAYTISSKLISPVKLMPGECKTDVLRFKSKTLANTMIEKMAIQFSNFATGQIQSFGSCHLFALEQACRGKSEAVTLTVKYEVDFTMKAMGYERKQRSRPITDTTGA
nr:MAG: capsid protein [Cressdnaviricota sp.]